jgi:hypothetical protein
MKLLTCCFPFLITVTIAISCSSPKSPSLLQGVWKVERVVNLDKDETLPGDNRHYMFTEKHLMTIGGKDDRPIVENNFDQMSHEEILSQLPAGGGFMRYTIQDGKIHRTTLFALSEYFEGKTIITEFEVTQDKLILRDDHLADGQLREWHMTRVE